MRTRPQPGWRVGAVLLALGALLGTGSCAFLSGKGRRAQAREGEVLPPTVPLTGEPSYDEARSLLASGKTSLAEEVLSEESDLFQGVSLQADRGKFLLGILALRNDRPEKALRHFSEISGGYALVGDYRLWFEAEALRALGRPEEARERLVTLTLEHPDSIWFNKALWKVFEIDYEMRGAEEVAEFASDFLLSKWTKTEAFQEHAGRALSLFASSLEAAGSTREALDLLEWLYRDYPTEADALEARPKIDRMRRQLKLSPLAPTNREILARIKAFYRAGMRSQAWDELNPLLHRLRPDRSGPGRTDYVEALRWKGSLYGAQGDDDKAIRLYLGAIQNGFDDDGTFRFRLAKLRSRTSNETAIKNYLLLVKHHPRSKLAPEALYTAARLAQFANNSRLAGGLFGRLFDEYPRSEWVPLALFNQGWIALRQERYEMATDTFARIISGHSDSDEFLRALYWAGRAQELLGDEQRARGYYERLVAENAVSYYGTLGRMRLDHYDPADVILAAAHPSGGEPPFLRLPDSFNRSEKELRDLIEGFGGSQKHVLERAGELITLGLLPEAEEEIERVARANAGNRGAVETLIGLFEEAGAWRSAQRWAYELNGERPGHITEETARFWQTLYPLGFAPYVREYARRQGLDPHLVLSIIREESHFDPHITSWADARGLMQIIPPTGEQIARAHRVREFDPEQLYDPETNIRFGCYYLASLIKRFEGNPVLAIASYNGGPHNVEKWKRQHGSLDLDVFIEEIPFQETRNYVKKVTRSWGLYQSLYGSGPWQYARNVLHTQTAQATANP